jgi:hypothetical protein
MNVHRGAQPHRHLHQYVVACLVPEQIVDRLEAVEVKNADGERRGIVGAIADQAIDLVIETPVIAKPGQRIREGHIGALPSVPVAGIHRLHSRACSVCSFVFASDEM